MSFRCKRCHKAQPAHTAQNKLVLKTREKTYLDLETNEVVGKGFETEKEIAVCGKCFAAANKPKVE